MVSPPFLREAAAMAFFLLFDWHSFDFNSSGLEHPHIFEDCTIQTSFPLSKALIPLLLFFFRWLAIPPEKGFPSGIFSSSFFYKRKTGVFFVLFVTSEGFVFSADHVHLLSFPRAEYYPSTLVLLRSQLIQPPPFLSLW